MANLIVVIELVAGRPHPASLEVLGQARRIGSRLGATVYAVAPCTATPGYDDDDVVAVLSRHGADKVLLANAPAHSGTMRWGTHGAAVLVACATMQPLLLLLAATQASRDLAGRLAARLGAACLSDAWVELEDDGIVLWEGAGEGARRLDGEIDFTVVAAIPPGRYATARGDEEAEIELLEAPAFPGPDFEEIPGSASCPQAVVLGDGEPAELLARALGGVRGGPGTPPCSPLAIALDGSAGGLDRVHAEARIALGPQASSCSAADYAVDGEVDALARALADLASRS